MALHLLARACKNASGILDKMFTTTALDLIFNHTSVRPFQVDPAMGPVVLTLMQACEMGEISRSCEKELLKET